MIERVNIDFKAWTKILIFIYENPDTTIMNIHQALKISPAHNSKICNLLIYKNLVKKKYTKNSTELDLTDNGIIVAFHLIEINKIINLGGKTNARNI